MVYRSQSGPIDNQQPTTTSLDQHWRPTTRAHPPRLFEYSDSSVTARWGGGGGGGGGAGDQVAISLPSEEGAMLPGRSGPASMHSQLCAGRRFFTHCIKACRLIQQFSAASPPLWYGAATLGKLSWCVDLYTTIWPIMCAWSYHPCTGCFFCPTTPALFTRCVLQCTGCVLVIMSTCKRKPINLTLSAPTKRFVRLAWQCQLLLAMLSWSWPVVRSARRGIRTCRICGTTVLQHLQVCGGSLRGAHVRARHSFTITIVIPTSVLSSLSHLSLLSLSLSHIYIYIHKCQTWLCHIKTHMTPSPRTNNGEILVLFW